MVTFYIDAMESNCLARYSNHSCRNNAVFSKLMVVGKEKPFLMIKATEDISKGKEIFTHYGDEFESLLQNKGGCC